MGALGAGCHLLDVGDRVGVPWLHHTDGDCQFCRRGEENLCERADFTGWTVDGGYADALTVPEAFAVRLPDGLGDVEAAPLLCAGVIGYRALRRGEVRPGERVALLGFGASAHLALQVLSFWGCETVVLTRGERHRELARELGASWVGHATDAPPEPCDRAIVLSTIPPLDYALLWRERSLRSVANMTRADAAEFMALAAEAGIRTEVETYPLEAANEALGAIAADAVRGAAVLAIA